MVVPGNSLNVAEYVKSWIRKMVTLFICVYVIYIVMYVICVIYVIYIYSEGLKEEERKRVSPSCVFRHSSYMSYGLAGIPRCENIWLSRLPKQRILDP